MYQRIHLDRARQTRLRRDELANLPCRRTVPRPGGPPDGYDAAAGRLVVKLVSVLDRVHVADLHRTSRAKADVCLSRQKAMYLMHTVFSAPYHKVAEFFGRDRTTVSHACRLVEDLRDNEEFDKEVEAMENLLVSARALCEAADGEYGDA